MLQQPLFAPEAPAVDGQFAVASNHSVTRNNYGDWVIVAVVENRDGTLLDSVYKVRG
jgi:citrate lyase alpha subunit